MSSSRKIAWTCGVAALVLAGCDSPTPAGPRPGRAVRSPLSAQSPEAEVLRDPPTGYAGVPLAVVETSNNRNEPVRVRTVADTARETARAVTATAPAPPPPADLWERHGTINLTPSGTPPERK